MKVPVASCVRLAFFFLQSGHLARCQPATADGWNQRNPVEVRLAQGPAGASMNVRSTSTPAGRKRQRASFDRSLMSHMGLDMAAGHDRVPPGRSPHLKGYLSAGTCTNVPLANGATSLPGNGLPRRTAFSRFRREKSRRRDLPRAPENWVWMLRGQSKHVLERRCRGKPTLGFDSATKQIPFG